MEKEIEYMGEKIIVNTNGTFIWNGKIRKIHYSRDGYPRITINTSKGWRTPPVHRLMAVAFIPNPDNLPEVDHINFDRADYSIENLQWITRLDNVRRSVCNKPDMTGPNNPNYSNHKLSQFYKEHPDIAKIKQGRPGKQNGRYIDGSFMSEKV